MWCCHGGGGGGGGSGGMEKQVTLRMIASSRVAFEGCRVYLCVS